MKLCHKNASINVIMVEFELENGFDLLGRSC